MVFPELFDIFYLFSVLISLLKILKTFLHNKSNLSSIYGYPIVSFSSDSYNKVPNQWLKTTETYGLINLSAEPLSF